MPGYSFGAVKAFAFAQVWSERMEVFYCWRDGRGLEGRVGADKRMEHPKML